MLFSERFFSHLKNSSLIEKDDRILVAFSGGKDSLCLLFLLSSFAEKLGIEVGACHIHHGIRGKEADGDLEFCKNFCAELKIPFYEKQIDTPAFCQKEKIGLEEGARILRYKALEEIALSENFTKIATAHTASDQAETVLFRVIRGSGPLGRSGIPEKRGKIIRPLLPFFSEEILDFLKTERLSFKIDSTNNDNLFSRNRIRNKILPEMEKVNPGVKEALIRQGTLSLWQDQLVKALCDRWEKAENVFAESGKVPLAALKPLYEKCEGYPLLYEVFSRMARKAKIVIDFERFTSIIRLLNHPNEGKIIEISHGFCFTIEKENIVFFKNDPEPCCIQYQIKLHKGDNFLPAPDALLTLSDKRRGEVENINKKLLIIHAASDKIEGDLFARPMQSGDTIPIGNMTRTVKKLLQEAGVSAKMRPYVPLICDNKGIVWIPFVGLCDRVRESNTGEIFTMSLRGKMLSRIENNREDD